MKAFTVKESGNDEKSLVIESKCKLSFAKNAKFHNIDVKCYDVSLLEYCVRLICCADAELFSDSALRSLFLIEGHNKCDLIVAFSEEGELVRLKYLSSLREKDLRLRAYAAVLVLLFAELGRLPRAFADITSGKLLKIDFMEDKFTISEDGQY